MEKSVLLSLPIFHALLLWPADCAPPLALTFLLLLDAPHTRALMRPRLELHRVFSAFTDIDSPSDTAAAGAGGGGGGGGGSSSSSGVAEGKLAAAHQVLLLLSRSLTGVLRYILLQSSILAPIIVVFG